MISRKVQVLLAVSLIATSGSAFASKAARAVSECRDAVAQEQGTDAVAKLKKVQSRGSGYDVWLNVKDGETELRSFCSLKRGKVDQVVTEDGRWTSRHPSRPDLANVAMRTAMINKK